MPKYFSNLQFWCPECALWLVQKHYPSWNPPFVSFYAQEVSQSTTHRSQESGGFIGKEEPASRSLTQKSGMWSSVSLHTENGISSEQNDQETGGNSARPRCLIPPSGKHNWLNPQTPWSLPGRNCCSQASVTAAFSKQGLVPGCSCPPGTRSCSNVKI